MPVRIAEYIEVGQQSLTIVNSGVLALISANLAVSQGAIDPRSGPICVSMWISGRFEHSFGILVKFWCGYMGIRYLIVT